MSDAAELPLETDVATLAKLRQQQADFLLLDVREQHEYDFARIEGSVLIPMSELRERFSELEEHQQRHIVVHCHHGGRSLQVTQALRNAGFAKTQNLAGGIDQWSEQIDSSVPRY